MRYGISSAKEVLRAWGERNYRFAMLLFMALELALLGILVLVEILDYLRN